MRTNARAPHQRTAWVLFLILLGALLAPDISHAQVNRPPLLVGTPSTSVRARTYYWFRPWVRDADGDRLSFRISNKPAWAKFDATQGRLFGTPTQPGAWRNIRISVTDGHQTVTLPGFTLTVLPALPVNVPPTITGRPLTAARPGFSYSFRPSAKDANGDALVYSIRNKPGWARFDTLTGRLWGIPTRAGIHERITITARDRVSTATLPAFSIAVTSNIHGAVTLAWGPPTSASSGSGPAELAGYLIHYGTAPTVLDRAIFIPSPADTMHVIENLRPARYYFAMRSVTVQWTYSPLSNVISEVVAAQ